jgi:hypothetical protein
MTSYTYETDFLHWTQEQSAALASIIRSQARQLVFG